MQKRAIFVAVLLPLVIGIVRAEGKVDTRNEPKPDVSYAFGMALGADLKETGLTIDYGQFTEGLRASMEGERERLSFDEAMELIQATFLELRQLKLAENLENGREFLRQNAEKADVQVTESGLQYTVIQEGDGEKPTEADTVRVHYEGRLIDGTVFDSSLERGQPVEFPLDGGVIPGWIEGLVLMNTGSRYQLFIPAELGYGEWDADGIIPPNSVLIFDVELLDIVRDDEGANDEIAPDNELADEKATDELPAIGGEEAVAEDTGEPPITEEGASTGEGTPVTGEGTPVTGESAPVRESGTEETAAE
jgi:FKBP-type peptidyl-prolyl cis-trans isomerase